MCNLSIIVPGYRHSNWLDLYNSLEKSCYGLSYELIMVGPDGDISKIIDKPYFRFIRDYGAPTRCAQIGLLQSSGEIMCWGSDDGVFLDGALYNAYTILKSMGGRNGVTLRYKEGGNSMGDPYWVAYTHADLRLPGIPNNYKITPLGMYYNEYIKSIGGWDCRFEHLNLSNHDLAFRVQNDGGSISLSPTEVFSCSWSAPQPDWQPVGRAYREVDKPLLDSIYSVNQSNRIGIDINNWMSSPEKWEKRFGK